jgi:hypothetical protein
MSIRRFTRLTNAFSKKVENHAAAVALWFMYYNFCRVHQTLRVTPAMEFVRFRTQILGGKRRARGAVGCVGWQRKDGLASNSLHAVI